MNLQEEHDNLVEKLENSKLSKSIRSLLLFQQYRLAVKLYIEKNGVKVIPMCRNKYRKNYIERIYVNKSFDSVSKSASSNILTELKRIRDERIAQNLKGVSF